MEEQMMDRMRESNMTPAELITLMFERTDEDGILYIPGFHYDSPGWMHNAPGSTDENDSYRCKMDWNLQKHDRVQEQFANLYNAIREIADCYEELYDDPDQAKQILSDGAQLEVWNRYLKPTEMGNFDGDKIDAIYEKMDTVAWVKMIAEKIANGQPIEKYEKEVMMDCLDVRVTQEEQDYYQAYIEHKLKQAELRLGDNICANDVLTRARRLARLFSLNAPQIVILAEAHQLASAFVLHECGISRELVDDAVRLRLEQMELMSEEELDELYRPQKANTRKSLAPLFVFEILTNHSNSKTHLRQNDILKKLSEYPYEISLERKALSRIIHNLIDSPQYAVFQDKTGVWVDQE